MLGLASCAGSNKHSTSFAGLLLNLVSSHLQWIPPYTQAHLSGGLQHQQNILVSIQRSILHCQKVLHVYPLMAALYYIAACLLLPGALSHCLLLMARLLL